MAKPRLSTGPPDPKRLLRTPMVLELVPLPGLGTLEDDRERPSNRKPLP